MVSFSACFCFSTTRVRVEFDKLFCIISYIPGGCISFVQVLDISLNKLLTTLITQVTFDYTDKYFEKYKTGGFSITNKRILSLY
jgi:hypothetical protein